MKKATANAPLFYKVLPVQQGAQEATILLYSYIGETIEWDDEKGWKMGGVTDIQFVQELNALAAEVPVIHLRINSPGGNFFHGNAICTAIQNCPAEVHTWNDGLVASMAADIWLCGKKRHMAKNAIVMIHSAWSYCAGHSQDMRDCAEIMDKLNTAAIIAVSASTGIPEDELRSRYYADYKDHYLTYADAQADGLITEEAEEYEAAQQAPAEPQKLSYKQLIEAFEKSQQHPADTPGFWATLLQRFNKRAKPVDTTTTTHITEKDMTFEEFKTALKEGQIDAAAVRAHLDLQADPPPPPNPVATEIKALTDKITAMESQLTAAQKSIEALSAQPGAQKSAPGAPAIDAPGGDTPPNVLEEYNKKMAAIATSDDTPLFTPISK